MEKIYLISQDNSFEYINRRNYATNEEEIKRLIINWNWQEFVYRVLVDSFKFNWDENTVEFLKTDDLSNNPEEKLYEKYYIFELDLI